MGMCPITEENMITERENKAESLIKAEGYSQRERCEVIERIIISKKMNGKFRPGWDTIDSYQFKHMTMKELKEELRGQGGVIVKDGLVSRDSLIGFIVSELNEMSTERLKRIKEKLESKM